jgi:hypothetical protein
MFRTEPRYHKGWGHLFGVDTRLADARSWPPHDCLCLDGVAVRLESGVPGHYGSNRVELSPLRTTTTSPSSKSWFPDLKGFSRGNLKYMRAFAEAWPEEPIVQAVLAQITGGQGLTTRPCQNRVQTRRVGALGVSFERKADSPNC